LPEVSVIIPTYNRAHLIREAIDSVLKQTYRDFEIIVVDDGSTDNTREVIDSYIDPHIRYIYQENQGVSGAMNTGILVSKAKYIAWLASDNVMLEESLQKQVDFMEQHPEIGFCYSQAYFMDEKGRPIWWRKARGDKKSCVRDGKEEIMRLLFRGGSGPNMICRYCFDEVGLFDTSLRVGEDIDMCLRLSRKYSAGYIAEPMGKARIHSKSITGQKTLEELEGTQKAFVQHALQGLESEPDYRFLRRKAYFGLYCYLAEEAARGGKRMTGFRYILKALQACPELLLQKDGISFIISVAGSFFPKWSRNLVKRVLVTLKTR
jgi:glycosyltransferase involved in cell wall biosynthesis